MGLVSDFDWKAVVKSGVTKGLTGAVKTAGTWILGWGLNSVFGTDFGKDTDKEKFLAALDQVQGEMGVMNGNIEAISEQVDVLTTEMGIDFEKVLSTVAEQRVHEAISLIKTHWKDFQGMVEYRLTLQKEGKLPTEPPGRDQSLDFANQVVTSWDIPTAVTTISDALLRGPEADAKGLINTWTDLYTMSSLDGRIPPTEAYRAQEQSVLNLLHWLFLGHTLVLNARLRQAKEDGQDLEIVGKQYFANRVEGPLAEIMKLYVQSVHRMILSHYQVPDPDEKGFRDFLSQEQVDYILGRTYLLQHLVLRDSEDASSPGLVAAAYARPSQVKGTKGPKFNPGSGYPASTGELLTVSSAYRKRWFKVFDVDSSDQKTVRPYSESDVQIIRYRWEWPTNPPEAGETLEVAEGVRAKVGHYDKTTLECVDGPTENSVRYAYSTDRSGVVRDIVADTEMGWSAKAEESFRSGAYNITPEADVSPGNRYVRMFGYVQGDYTKDRTWKAHITRELLFPEDADQLWVAVDTRWDLTAKHKNPSIGYLTVPSKTKIEIQFAGSTLKKSKQDAKTEAKDRDHPYRTLLPVAVERGPVSLVFYADMEAVSHSKFMYNSTGKNTVDSGWRVARVTLSWVQPKIEV